uniref:Uncharacterized protein n=1 Tax=Marmota marmota marmota TaxID=9994 RepID=A0A8C6A9L6_MARMA
MPGTRPMRRTIMCRRLLPVSTFTALPMVVLSRLSPFTSVILSPTHRPARSVPESGEEADLPTGQNPQLPTSPTLGQGLTTARHHFGPLEPFI